MKSLFEVLTGVRWTAVEFCGEVKDYGNNGLMGLRPPTSGRDSTHISFRFQVRDSSTWLLLPAVSQVKKNGSVVTNVEGYCKVRMMK